MVLIRQGKIRKMSEAKPVAPRTIIPKWQNTIDHKPTNQSNIFDTNLPKPLHAKIPDFVSGVYVDDLNIINIHEAIIMRFAALQAKVPSRTKEIEKLRKTHTTSYIEQNARNLRANELEEEISNLDVKWKDYVSRAFPLLLAYQPIASNASKGIVIIGRKVVEDPELVKRRLSIIEDYCDVASDYIATDLVWKGLPAPRCPNCNILFDELILDEEEGYRLCECGFETPHISKNSRYKDNSKVSIGSRNDYDEYDTFVKGLQLYSGTYPVRFPANMRERLNSYFKLKGFPQDDEIKRRPLNRKGWRQGTSVNLLCEALKETGMSNYYNCCNLIAHIYWEALLPDISAIQPNILSKYERLQAVYKEIKTRTSSLNFNILLFILLKSESYPCDWEDFKMLISRSSLEYHQKMIKPMCARTGILYTDFI